MIRSICVYEESGYYGKSFKWFSNDFIGNVYRMLLLVDEHTDTIQFEDLNEMHLTCSHLFNCRCFLCWEHVSFNSFNFEMCISHCRIWTGWTNRITLFTNSVWTLTNNEHTVKFVGCCRCCWCIENVELTRQNTLSAYWCSSIVCVITHILKYEQKVWKKTKKSSSSSSREEKGKIAFCNRHQIWLHILLGQTFFNAIACDDDARISTQTHAKCKNILLIHILSYSVFSSICNFFPKRFFPPLRT